MKLSLKNHCGMLVVSLRIGQAMRKLKCETIHDVTTHHQEEWLALRNFGRGSLQGLNTALALHGFKLRPTPPPAVEVTLRQYAANDPVKPPTKLRLSMAPDTGPHAKALKLDEVLDIAVRLTRSIQLFKRTKSEESVGKCLKYHQQLKQHFPSLTPEESARMANLLVHAGSLSFRHAMGMTVVLPQGQTIEHMNVIEADGSNSNRRYRRFVWLEDGSKLGMNEALAHIAEKEGLVRFKPSEVRYHMERRGWRLRVKKPAAYILAALDDSSQFRRCTPKGVRVVFRYLKDTPTEPEPEPVGLRACPGSHFSPGDPRRSS